MTNEQIQELEIAAKAAGGDEWQYMRPSIFSNGYITNNEGKPIVNTDKGGVPASCARFIKLANPSAILSLLAEREADKNRLAELKGTLNLASASYAGEGARADALQADLDKAESMITQYSNALSQAANDKVQWVVMETGFRQRIAQLERGNDVVEDK